MRMPTSKVILKWTAIVVLIESMYALVVLKIFFPIQTCSAIISLFVSNTIHEHTETYLSKKVISDDDK